MADVALVDPVHRLTQCVAAESLTSIGQAVITAGQAYDEFPFRLSTNYGELAG